MDRIPNLMEYNNNDSFVCVCVCRLLDVIAGHHTTIDSAQAARN